MNYILCRQISIVDRSSRKVLYYWNNHSKFTITWKLSKCLFSSISPKWVCDD